MCDLVTISQLSATQRAMVGAKLATLKNGSNQHTKEEGSQNCPPSIEDAAASLNVSKSSIKTAKQVIDSKSQPLIAAVESGDVGDKQLEIDAAEVRLRSERRLGELKDMPKAKGAAETRVNKKPALTLDSLGIDKNLAKSAHRRATRMDRGGCLRGAGDK